MAVISREQPLSLLQENAHGLAGEKSDFDPLLDLIGQARFVLLGEASHGTHEFYKARAELTKRLVEEKNFTVIAWEADWPDALRVSRYIRGTSADQTALESLADFERFPAWMWRNAEILDFIGWLRAHNDAQPANRQKVGIYGLDLYSLYSSAEAVIGYLDRVDPEAARQARHRYSCFEDFGEDPQAYGATAGVHRSFSCEDEVVEQLIDLHNRRAQLTALDGRMAADEFFFAEQNARVAKNAEHYYRAMFRGRPNTWNLRDTHMVDTLQSLIKHLKQYGEQPKAVVWAHNSHLGDARATQMGEHGELNVGQLVRERYGGEAVSVGFTTYVGTVTAASDWGEPAERKIVRPGLNGSVETLFHDADIPKFLLTLRDTAAADQLRSPRLERAIGVIYRPETERWSHYFLARLADQFDAVIHFDQSRAVEPLERTALWEKGDAPETYPSGI